MFEMTSGGLKWLAKVSCLVVQQERNSHTPYRAKRGLYVRPNV